MVNKTYLVHPFFMLVVYYATFIAAYFAAISSIGLLYDAARPLLSNLMSLSVLLLPPFVSALIIGILYAGIMRANMRFKARLRLALLAMLVPSALIATIILTSLSSATLPLSEFDVAIVLGISGFALLVFLSICLVLPMSGWIYLRCCHR